MMGELLSDFFTVTGMIIYFLGIGTACVWHTIKYRVLHRAVQPVNWTTMGIIAGVSAMIFVGMQNTQLATEVKACQREFNVSIANARRISGENDDLSIEQRRVFLAKDDAELQMWMDLINPPPGIADLPINAPARQQYGLDVVAAASKKSAAYAAQIRASQDRQDDLKRQREAHPLPDPTCGK